MRRPCAPLVRSRPASRQKCGEPNFQLGVLMGFVPIERWQTLARITRIDVFGKLKLTKCAPGGKPRRGFFMSAIHRPARLGCTNRRKADDIRKRPKRKSGRTA